MEKNNKKKQAKIIKVLSLYEQGETQESIAQELGISIRSVKSYIKESKNNGSINLIYINAMTNNKVQCYKPISLNKQAYHYCYSVLSRFDRLNKISLFKDMELSEDEYIQKYRKKYISASIAADVFKCTSKTITNWKKSSPLYHIDNLEYFEEILHEFIGRKGYRIKDNGAISSKEIYAVEWSKTEGLKDERLKRKKEIIEIVLKLLKNLIIEGIDGIIKLDNDFNIKKKEFTGTENEGICYGYSYRHDIAKSLFLYCKDFNIKEPTIDNLPKLVYKNTRGFSNLPDKYKLYITNQIKDGECAFYDWNRIYKNSKSIVNNYEDFLDKLELN